MTGRLLLLGAGAGPLYILVGLVQMAIRDGFDPRLHALSVLANGELGWIQVANFLLNGALVVAGAVGCRRALATRRAGTWGPVLLALYGLGMIGAGIFRADPANGFPSGAEVSTELTRAGMLHFVSGAIAFYSLIAACFVFARRFFHARRTTMGWYSVATGLGFFASFAAIASGAGSGLVMIAFYIAIAWIWIWHTAVLWDVRRGLATAGREAR